LAAPKTEIEVLHWDARIFYIHRLLSNEECDHIIKKATARLARSGVVNTATGGSVVDDVRTSEGMFMNRAEDPVVETIERRIANFSHLPVWHGEGLQVLRYQRNQKYDAHWDFFFDKENSVNGGNRYATVLTFLNDVEEGGETVFPKVPAPNGDNGPLFTECARYHLAAKPRKGDAVMFHSMKPNGQLEERSMHTACPVTRGIKWSMPKWIHVEHYNLGGDKYDNELKSKLDEEAELLRTTDRRKAANQGAIISNGDVNRSDL